MKKITRRTLLCSVATAAAIAQTPPAEPNAANAAIAKVPLPQSTEPAFTFKA